MKTKLFLTFLKKHWLKLVGAGLSIGSFAIDGLQHEREMMMLKESVKKEVMQEILKSEVRK